LGAFLLGDLIRDALRMSNIGVVKAALWMDINPGQLERQLQGKEHLHFDRYMKLPLLFFQWFALLLLVKVGLPRVIRRSIPIAVALAGKKRMARLELSAQKEEQAS